MRPPKHLVNAAVLEALGPTGFFINVARGSVVDQDALVKAIEAGTIAGAGPDVFEAEPKVPEALFNRRNVVAAAARGQCHARNAAGDGRSRCRKSRPALRRQTGENAGAGAGGQGQSVGY